MNVLILGANFKNKGAELMLISVKKQILKRNPESKFFLSLFSGSKNDIKQNGFNLFDFPLLHVGNASQALFKFSLLFPKFFLLLYNLKNKTSIKYDKNSFQEIDLVLDVSGYAYSQKWGDKPINNLLVLLRYCNNLKIPYIFMPQAFGPFTDSQKKAFSIAIEKSKYVFARDSISYNNLIEINNIQNKIYQFPDITLLKADNLEKFERIDYDFEYVCIVPNVRMLDKAGDYWKNNYLEFLEECVNKVLDDTKVQVFLMKHTLNEDTEIINNVYESINKPERVKIISETDPNKLKYILGNANFNIVSRFHSAAASLSSSVPCIITSWAHKYEKLAEEYEILEFCIKKGEVSLINSLINKSKNLEIREKLIKNNKLVSIKSDQMYNKIFEK